MSKIIIYIVTSINTFSFFLFAYDKWLATNTKKRISEKTLLLLTFFGASIGSVLSMFIFRHKISKPSFWWKVLVIVIFQMIVIYLIFRYLKK
ncbi:DUF1294 domain-containing protein [Flavobacterium sp.]|uniref:DUF1294 domain-containing protein n=1 Tax=Flavobacterium sp. TaxID=239 RepID=UPI00343013A2